MEAINETAKLIKELGPKKAAGYFLLATVLVGGAYYVFTRIKRSSKTKEQNNVSKIKLRKSKQLLTLKSKKSSNSMPIVKKKNVCRQIRK